MVFNDPVSNGRSVVELALAHLIALSRRLYETEPATRAGRWDKSSAERYEIRGKALGVLGLGNIGRQVARAAEDLGMQVRFYDSRHAPCEVGLEFGWDLATSVRDLLRTSDCVTVHLSATDVHGRSNRGVLDGGLLHDLGADRPDESPRIFLNLSRGFLHSAESLLEAVERGAIRRAAVDVYPNEPGLDQAWTNPYAREPRIAVTPHIGAATLEAQPRIARRVAHTILQFAQYGTLRDCVFDPRARLQLLEEGARGGQTLLAVAHATTRGTKRVVTKPSTTPAPRTCRRSTATSRRSGSPTSSPRSIGRSTSARCARWSRRRARSRATTERCAAFGCCALRRADYNRIPPSMSMQRPVK